MSNMVNVNKNSTEYKEALEIWNDFCNEIKHGNRFFIGETDAGKKMISLLKEITKKQPSVSPISNKLKLHRARIGDFVNNFTLKQAEEQLLAPPKEKVNDGRCNPSGIPYLYLTANVDTAICEVRAQVGDIVTIATVEVGDKCKIFSFVAFEFYEKSGYGVLIKDEIARNLLYIIKEKFSEVVTDKINYIPLQFIVEYTKSEGYKAICFDSSLSEGKNYILFSYDNAKVIDRKLYKIKSISYTTEEIM